MSQSVFVHETAVVDRGADIGAGSKVWHFCHVAAGARIGMHCTLAHGVYVGSNVSIGDGVTVANQVSLFDGVEIGDRVFVGPSAVFTNLEVPRAQLKRPAAATRIRVGEGATIGANATLLAGIAVGPWAFVAAGAVVTHDVPAQALVVGVPARVAGWVCVCGHRLDESDRCAGCGARYQRRDGVLRPLPGAGT
ncbi:MAG: N-acetyltransferase [Deltaproteobacteria bacterium]|nr:N-acetyltransferase [Deltaproteobacteria bacterium]